MLRVFYLFLLTAFDHVKSHHKDYVNPVDLSDSGSFRHLKDVISKQLLKRKSADSNSYQRLDHLTDFLKNGNPNSAGGNQMAFSSVGDDPGKKQFLMANAFISASNLFFGPKKPVKRGQIKTGNSASMPALGEDVNLDLESLKQSYSGFSEENNEFSSSGMDRKRRQLKYGDPISCYLTGPKNLTCTHNDIVYKIVLPRKNMDDEDIGRIIESIYRSFEKSKDSPFFRDTGEAGLFKKKRTSTYNLNLFESNLSDRNVAGAGNESDAVYLPVRVSRKSYNNYSKDPKKRPTINRFFVAGNKMSGSDLAQGASREKANSNEERRRNWLALMATNGLTGVDNYGGQRVSRKVRKNLLNVISGLASRKSRSLRSPPRRKAQKHRRRAINSMDSFVNQSEKNVHSNPQTVQDGQVVNNECKGCPCPRPCRTTFPPRRFKPSLCPRPCPTECATTCPTTCSTTCSTTSTCSTTCSTTCRKTSKCPADDSFQWPRKFPWPDSSGAQDGRQESVTESAHESVEQKMVSHSFSSLGKSNGEPNSKESKARGFLAKIRKKFHKEDSLNIDKTTNSSLFQQQDEKRRHRKLQPESWHLTAHYRYPNQVPKVDTQQKEPDTGHPPEESDLCEDQTERSIRSDEVSNVDQAKDVDSPPEDSSPEDYDDRSYFPTPKVKNSNRTVENNRTEEATLSPDTKRQPAVTKRSDPSFETSNQPNHPDADQHISSRPVLKKRRVPERLNCRNRRHHRQLGTIHTRIQQDEQSFV